jgi:hypothetical protein
VTGEGACVERIGVVGGTMEEVDMTGLGTLLVLVAGTEETATDGKVALFVDETELDREWA